MTILSRPRGITADSPPVAPTVRATAPASTQSYLTAVTEPMGIAAAAISTEVTPYKATSGMLAPTMDEVALYSPAEDYFQKQLDALSVGWKRAREEDQQQRESDNERILKMERDQRDWNERSQQQAKASADGIDALAAVLAEANKLLAIIANRDRESSTPVTEPDTPSRTSSRTAKARPGQSASAK